MDAVCRCRCRCRKLLEVMSRLLYCGLVELVVEGQKQQRAGGRVSYVSLTHGG